VRKIPTSLRGCHLFVVVQVSWVSSDNYGGRGGAFDKRLNRGCVGVIHLIGCDTRLSFVSTALVWLSVIQSILPFTCSRWLPKYSGHRYLLLERYQSSWLSVVPSAWGTGLKINACDHRMQSQTEDVRHNYKHVARC